MASQAIQDSQLRLKFDAGLDGEGKTIYKNKNYNNVKTSATADQLYDVANAIADLTSRPLVDINRNDTFIIIGE